MKDALLKFYINLRNNDKKILFLFLAVAFVVRLVFILILDPHGYYLSDARHYDNAAKSILAGEGWGEKYYRSPLYPLVMAFVYFISGPSFVNMRLFDGVLSVLICLFVFLIAKHVFNKKIAFIATAIAAVFPHFIALTGILYSTNLFTLLLAVSCYFALKSDTALKVKYVVLSAIIAGLAALTIPSILFILPFWMVFLVFARKSQIVKRIGFVSLYILVFMAVLTPWTIRNYHKYDRLVLVRPLPNRVLPDFNSESVQNHKVESGFKEVSDYLREHPNGTKDDQVSNTVLHYLKHPVSAFQFTLKESIHFWALYPDRLNTMRPEYREAIQAKDNRMVRDGDFIWKSVKIVSIIVMLPVFLLALTGLFFGNIFTRKTLFLLLTIFPFSIGYSMIYAEVRYRIPVEPYILIFTAVGIYHLFLFIKSKYKKKRINDEIAVSISDTLRSPVTSEKLDS